MYQKFGVVLQIGKAELHTNIHCTAKQGLRGKSNLKVHLEFIEIRRTLLALESSSWSIQALLALFS